MENDRWEAVRFNFVDVNELVGPSVSATLCILCFLFTRDRHFNMVMSLHMEKASPEIN
jgi:hypothetical protein